VELSAVPAKGAATPEGRPGTASSPGKQKGVDPSDLVQITTETLHAWAARRFRQVDHWEISPGGWLPLPAHHSPRDTDEPIGELLDSLQPGTGPDLSQARSFRVRLSDHQGHRADIEIRRASSRRPARITFDVRGVLVQSDLDQIQSALSSRLPVRHFELTKFQYVDSP
jgi:hypothetical protein